MKGWWEKKRGRCGNNTRQGQADQTSWLAAGRPGKQPKNLSPVPTTLDSRDSRCHLDCSRLLYAWVGSLGCVPGFAGILPRVVVVVGGVLAEKVQTKKVAALPDQGFLQGCTTVLFPFWLHCMGESVVWRLSFSMPARAGGVV